MAELNEMFALRADRPAGKATITRGCMAYRNIRSAEELETLPAGIKAQNYTHRRLGGGDSSVVRAPDS